MEKQVCVCACACFKIQPVCTPSVIDTSILRSYALFFFLFFNMSIVCKCYIVNPGGGGGGGTGLKAIRLHFFTMKIKKKKIF